MADRRLRPSREEIAKEQGYWAGFQAGWNQAVAFIAERITRGVRNQAVLDEAQDFKAGDEYSARR